MSDERPDDEAQATTVAGWWEDWKQARAGKERIWQECLQNYMTEIDETKYASWPWRAKVSDTFSQESADTIASVMRNMLFPVSEEFFEVAGLDLAGRTHAPVLQSYLERVLHKMQFLERMGVILKQVAVTGNAPVMLTWKTVPSRKRRRHVKVHLATGERVVTVGRSERPAYDGPSMESLDVFDVVTDPMATTLESSPIIRRVVLPRVLAERRYPKAEWGALGQKAGAPSEDSDTLKTQRAAIFGMQTDESALGAFSRETEEVELLEVYGDCLIDDHLFEDHHVVVANRTLVVLSEANPLWGGRPMFWGTYDPLWFTTLGKGPLEPVRGTQELIDTFTNQKADILNLVISPMFKYVDDGIIDPENLFTRPGGGIAVGNINNLSPVSSNQNVALAYTEIEQLRSRGERSTGVSRMDMGQSAGGRRTAFEASIVRQGGSSRAIDIGKHLGNSLIEPILQFILDSVQQYRFGSGEVPDEALLGAYQVNFLGADMTALRQFELQQLTMFLEIIGRNPALSQALNPPELLGELIRIFRLRNRSIVKTPEEYRRAVEEAAQRESAQAGQDRQFNGAPGTPSAEAPEAVDAELAALLGGGGA